MNTYRTSLRTALWAGAALLTLAAAAPTHAEDHRQGHGGYRDGNHHYHAYSTHNGHRGYWDQRGGSRIWITVG